MMEGREGEEGEVWEGMPWEVGIAILRFLGPADLLSFSLVCRAAQAMAAENWLWREFCMQRFPQWSAERHRLVHPQDIDDWQLATRQGLELERNWHSGKAKCSPSICTNTSPISHVASTTAHQQANRLALSDHRLFLTTARLENDCNVVYMYDLEQNGAFRFARSFAHSRTDANKEVEVIESIHACDGCDQMVSCDSSLCVWRPSDGTRIFGYHYSQHEVLLCCHFWAMRSNLVACGSTDGSVLLFDLNKAATDPPVNDPDRNRIRGSDGGDSTDDMEEDAPPALVRKFSGDSSGGADITCLEIRDRLLVSGTGDREGLIHLIDIETGTELWSAGYRYRLHRVTFHGSDTILSTGRGEFVRMWDVRCNGGKQIARMFHGDWYHIHALRSSPDRHLVVTGAGISVRLWDDRMIDRSPIPNEEEEEEWLEAQRHEKEGSVPGLMSSVTRHTRSMIEDLVFNSRLMITASSEELLVWDFLNG